MADNVPDTAPDDEAREIWRSGGFRCLYHPESGFWWHSGRYDDAGRLVEWGEATVSQTRLLLDAIAEWFLHQQSGEAATGATGWENTRGDA